VQQAAAVVAAAIGLEVSWQGRPSVGLCAHLSMFHQQRQMHGTSKVTIITNHTPQRGHKPMNMRHWQNAL
jgi:hypothetical protein